MRMLGTICSLSFLCIFSPSSAHAIADDVKIRIDANDLVRVDHETLASIGWLEKPFIDELLLTTRDVDGTKLVETPVPILVDDADGDGRFGTGDAFYFYGQDAPTHRGWTAAEARYTVENVYWLSLRAGESVVMAERDVAPTKSPAIEPTAFEYWERFGDDAVYYNYTFHEDDNVDLVQTVDHLLATTAVVTDLQHRLPLHVLHPEPDTPVGFRAKWQNVSFTPVTFSASIVAGDVPEGTPLPETFQVSGNRAVTYDSDGLTLGSAFLSEGEHEFVTTVGEATNRLAVDDFEVGYRRLYVANDGSLRFTNDGETGRVRMTIASIGEAVILLDVSDADVPVLLVGSQLDASGETLTFEEELVADGDYVVCERSAVASVPRDDLTLDRRSSLRSLDPSNPALDADLLVVVADELRFFIGEWLRHREAQGRVVEVAAVSDVYDEFAGGLFTPEAIRRYVRFAAAERPAAGGVAPTALLLIGDANENYRGVGSIGFEIEPAANLVPTYMRPSDVSDLGFSKPIVASDEWFVEDLDGDGERGESPMSVGRVPAGSPREAYNALRTIVDFEVVPARRAVSKRALFIADDRYSTSGTGAGASAYACRPAEAAFQETSEEAAALLASGLPDFEVVDFYLSELLDDVPELGRPETCFGPPSCDWPCTREFVRNELDLDTTLIDELNRGHLVVAYNGHGNRNLISHEYVFAANALSTGEGLLRDVERLTNDDRAIWLLNAGSTGDFVKATERDESIGDCLAERLMLARNGGAVATIANTGFQWLSNNEPLQRTFFETLVDDLADDGQAVLGDVLRRVKNRLYADGNQSLQRLTHFLSLFGDPATLIRLDTGPPPSTARSVQSIAGVRAKPNPFRSGTVVEFDATRGSGRASLEIFDVSGRLVRSIGRAVAAGENAVRWDGRDGAGQVTPPGVYFYRLRVIDGDASVVRKGKLSRLGR